MADASPGDAAPSQDAGGLDSQPGVDCAFPGALDQSFGVGGFVLPVFGPGLAGAFSVAIEPGTSRILVAGGAPGGDSSAFTLLRLLPDGSLDPSFGTGGISQLCIAGHICGLSDVMLQSDGKIVGVGEIYGIGGIDGPDPPAIAVVRYETDGTPDPSFGSGGLVIDKPALHAKGVAGALDPLGRIVVTAASADGIEPMDNAYYTTLRFLPSGQRDSSFGVDGVAEAAFTNGHHVPRDLALQPDGRIIVSGGWSPFGGGGGAAGLVRYTPDGMRDPTFGSMGLLTIPFAGASVAQGVALDDSGRVVVVGYDSLGGVMTRLRLDGSPDPSFGTAGTVAGNKAHSKVAILPNGQLLLVGHLITAFHESSVAVQRYDPRGDPDPSFGAGGIATSSTNPHCNRGLHLAVQPDGKVVVVGIHGNCINDLHFLIARYCP